MAIDNLLALRFVAVTTAAAVLVMVAPAARAQSVEAEALFREGKRLIKEGQLAAGCDKLEASDRVEPSVGTELNLADCREQNNQLATAWATFLKAAGNARKAGNDEKREREARARAAALEPRLSYLTISVSDASKVEGLIVSRSGTIVDAALWNQGVPVDEGQYTITGQAPGHEPWSTTVTISGVGDKESVELPRFKALEDLVPVDDQKPPPDDPVADPRPDPVPVVGHDDSSPGIFTTRRKIAVGIAAAGVLGLSGAIVFGLKAKDLQSQADALCPEAACGNMMAIQLNDDAQSAALTSNLLLGVGAASVVGATVLWFLSAPDDGPANGGDGEGELSLTPTIGRDQVRLTLGGSF